MDAPVWLLSGIALHGASFTLVVITAQIYIDQRVDPTWRVRAQALLALMNGGVGNLLGYLGTAWWFDFCQRQVGLKWTLFWSGLALGVFFVGLYFLGAYQGIGVRPSQRSETP